jgi:hypothetical protein
MPNEAKIQEWQAPPREQTGAYKTGWINDLVQQGDSWVQAQAGLRNLNADIQLLMGTGQQRDLQSNLLQPDIRTFVETITDLRQIATLGSRSEQTKKYVSLYNDVFRYVFWDSHFVWNTRKALQYAMLGRGYLWQKWSAPHYGWGKPKIQFDWLGPREFLPEQLPPNNDVQGAYAGTVIRPMPIAEAHARFPQFQQWLTPFSRYDWKSYGTLGMARRMDFYDRYRFPGTEDASNWENKYAEIRYTWVRDLRINMTGQTQQMGVPGTTWGYTVPSLGDLIVRINQQNGLPESNKATVAESRMYPRLRLIITTPSCPVPLYDDTAFDWHSEIPIVQYDVNDWAWSPTGSSAVRSVADLEIARRDRISDVNTVLAVRKDPPMGHDISTGVSRTQMEKVDLLHAQGIRVIGKGDPSKWVKNLLPESVDIDEKDFKGIELLSASIKSSLGLTDITSLRELKLNIGEQGMDKFLENLGPMAKGIAVNIWIANSKHAHMLKYNIAQYMSVDDLVSMVGPEGVGLQVYDSDPGSLIPSHLPGEESNHASRYEKQERARWFCDQLKVISTPEQLLNITHTQERMLYMMFLQKGVQIPTSSVMEKLGVKDYEEQHVKWREEKLNEELWMLEAKKVVLEKQHELGLDPPPEKPGQGQGEGGGRPSTGQKANHASMKGSKSGNVRVVNSTS